MIEIKHFDSIYSCTKLIGCIVRIFTKIHLFTLPLSIAVVGTEICVFTVQRIGKGQGLGWHLLKLHMSFSNEIIEYDILSEEPARFLK